MEDKINSFYKINDFMQYTVVPVTFNVNFPGSCWTRYGFLFSVVQSLNIFPPGWLAVT